LYTEFGLAQCYSTNLGLVSDCAALPVGFDHAAVSTPTCAALALAYNLRELNAESFPFKFSSSCFPSP
jgi:hypothetical protein